MIAAAANWDYSTQVIQLLLARDSNIEVTEVALRNAASDQGCNQELLEMLLARDPNIKSTETVTTPHADN